jgi:hypothetical protein
MGEFKVGDKIRVNLHPRQNRGRHRLRRDSGRRWNQTTGGYREWIVHTLWSTTARTTQTKVQATRLTQNRKREAKGIPIVPMVSRENPLVAPRLVRLNAHDPIAQARRADTQRRQAAALKAWNRSDKPDWLDEKKYRDKIQPRLAAITIPALMAALDVSKPYAVDIRAGRRRPHPRHWLALAMIIGISKSEA